MSETGTETLGMKVAQPLRRNRKTTRTTRLMEMPMACSASTTDARMVLVRSLSMFSVTVGGSDAWNCGSTLRTESAVEMMLALGWRLICISAAGVAVGGPLLGRAPP